MLSFQDKLREKRKRDARRRLRRLLYLFLSLLPLFGIYAVLRWTDYFASGRIQIEGNKVVTVDEIKRISGLKEPVNLVAVDRGEIINILINDLRFESADVIINWPYTIRIKVEERKPLAYFTSAYKGYVKVDRQGIVLTAWAGVKDAQVPCISGIELGNVYCGDKVREARSRAILSFLDKLGEEGCSSIAEIFVDGNEVKMLLVSNLPIKLGKADEIVTKADDVRSLCQQMRDKVMDAQYIDYRNETISIKKNK